MCGVSECWTEMREGEASHRYPSALCLASVAYGGVGLLVCLPQGGSEMGLGGTLGSSVPCSHHVDPLTLVLHSLRQGSVAAAGNKT